MRRLFTFPHRLTVAAFGAALICGTVLLALPVTAQFPGGPGGLVGGNPAVGPGGTPPAEVQTAIAARGTAPAGFSSFQTAIASGTQPALPPEIQTAVASGTLPAGGDGFPAQYGGSSFGTAIAAGACATPTGAQATAVAARGTLPAPPTPPAEVQTAIAVRGTVPSDLATAAASGVQCASFPGPQGGGFPGGFPGR